MENWLVEGDFNMVEMIRDRCGGGHITVHGHELACWETLCFYLKISDASISLSYMHAHDSLAFSRSDRRQDGVNLSKLDRFYISEIFQEKGGHVGILPTTTFSDHAPIFITILEESKRIEKPIRITDAIISDENCKEHLVEIWAKYDELQSPSVERFMLLLEESVIYLNNETNKCYQQYERKQNALKHTLISLQRLQETYPSCGWIEDLLQKARSETQHIHQIVSDFKYNSVAAKWVSIGDRVTKEFFECIGPNYSRAPIQALRDDNGDRITNPIFMQSIATTFFEKMLTAEEVTQEVMVCRQKIWEHIAKTVTSGMNEQLTSPLPPL